MIFEPIKFPILRSDYPFRAAVTDATISGTLVPNATTVIPMTCSLILKFFAMLKMDIKAMYRLTARDAGDLHQ